MPPAINLVEMEERLAADKSGAYRDQIVDRFNGQLVELKRQVDAGLAPAEFDSAQKLNAALNAGVAVVNKVWQGLHGG
jgi:hypothetical protein